MFDCSYHTCIIIIFEKQKVSSKKRDTVNSYSYSYSSCCGWNQNVEHAKNVFCSSKYCLCTGDDAADVDASGSLDRVSSEFNYYFEFKSNDKSSHRPERFRAKLYLLLLLFGMQFSKIQISRAQNKFMTNGFQIFFSQTSCKYFTFKLIVVYRIFSTWFAHVQTRWQSHEFIFPSQFSRRIIHERTNERTNERENRQTRRIKCRATCSAREKTFARKTKIGTRRRKSARDSKRTRR